jgi:hypothetical protein
MAEAETVASSLGLGNAFSEAWKRHYACHAVGGNPGEGRFRMGSQEAKPPAQQHYEKFRQLLWSIS